MKYLEHVDYFRARKLRGKDLKDVCRGMEYIKKPAHSYVVKCGEEGDRFFIILRGEVSVWLPVQMKDMLAPLRKLKAAVLRCAQTNKSAVSLKCQGFDF